MNRFKGMGRQIETEIEVGEHCLKVLVCYDYEPEQRQTFTDPGFGASVEVTSVVNNGVEILHSLPDEVVAGLTEHCLLFETESYDDEPPEREPLETVHELDDEESLDYFNRFKAGDR